MGRNDHEIGVRISADTSQANRNVGQIADSIEALAGKLGGELGEQARQAAARLRELDALIRLAKDIMQRDAGASEDVTRFYLSSLSLRSEYPA